MTRRLWDRGGDDRDHEDQRSTRSRQSTRRTRGVSFLFVAAAAGSFFFVVEYIVCVWLRDHLARDQGEGKELLRLGVPAGVTLEVHDEAVARRGKHDRCCSRFALLQGKVGRP